MGKFSLCGINKCDPSPSKRAPLYIHQQKLRCANCCRSKILSCQGVTLPLYTNTCTHMSTHMNDAQVLF